MGMTKVTTLFQEGTFSSTKSTKSGVDMTLEKKSLNGEEETLQQCGRPSDMNVFSQQLKKKIRRNMIYPNEGQSCFL